MADAEPVKEYVCVAPVVSVVRLAFADVGGIAYLHPHPSAAGLPRHHDYSVSQVRLCTVCRELARRTVDHSVHISPEVVMLLLACTN